MPPGPCAVLAKGLEACIGALLIFSCIGPAACIIHGAGPIGPGGISHQALPLCPCIGQVACNPQGGTWSEASSTAQRLPAQRLPPMLQASHTTPSLGYYDGYGPAASAMLQANHVQRGTGRRPRAAFVRERDGVAIPRCRVGFARNGDGGQARKMAFFFGCHPKKKMAFFFG